jgi:hypothetical protein
VRDITGRKEAEEALRLAHSQMRAMFEHSNAGLVLFDAKPPYRVLAANRYTRSCGLSHGAHGACSGPRCWSLLPDLRRRASFKCFVRSVRRAWGKQC